MANAALLFENDAEGKTFSASTQVLTMPASTLLTPHPSERWRSATNSDYFVLDKRAVLAADTFMTKGLTCGPNSTVRLRLSALDASVETGEVFDSGLVSSGSQNFDADYGCCIWVFPEVRNWRWARLDIHDPDDTFVEAGVVADGLRHDFEYNFALSGTVQYIDRSRVAQSAAGLTLTLEDNYFRRLALNFDQLSEDERYDVIELMDQKKGIHRNVLMITDIDDVNLPRASFFGLITELTPVTYTIFTDLARLFGKQFKLDERI